MLAKKLESAAKAVESAYIEDVFSTYLYTGTAANQTITNGIDLSTKGGLVWLKSRSVTGNNWTQDTDRGVNSVLYPNLTNAAGNPAGTAVSAFNTTGFSLGTNTNINNSGDTYASWTFRKQAKFFDIVTYSGNSTASRQISHNLGATPGCIIIKSTTGGTAGYPWIVWHTSLAANTYLQLNATDAAASSSAYVTAVSSTTFTINSSQAANLTGDSYVAYLFAHNAGGFGLTGTDNVISCGSYTGNGSTTGPVVTLGYEPQWLMVKRTDDVDDWNIADNMRGLFVGDTSTTANSPRLRPNLSNAEQASGWVIPTATGFQLQGPNAASGSYNASGGTYIYIAVRRGPMKVPTVGTTVFSPNSTSGTTGTPITTGFPIDWQLLGINAGNVLNQRSSTRLTGVNTNGSSNSQYLATSSTNAEAATGSVTLNWGNTGFQVPSLNSGSPIITWNFQRAPSFFDVVCYTGTGTSGTAITHNLGVVPELIIIKGRSYITDWAAYSATLGNTQYLIPNTTAAAATSSLWWNNTSPTSTTFTLGNGSRVNNTSSDTYVAYLFATCPGVSKVGSYTGNGSNQTINCGFTGGARFVLIKRTDSTGDWYVWDTARGIVSGNDPHLSLNTTAAEVTTDDTIDPDSTGFIVNQLSATNVNVSSATYIYLAIA